MKSKLFFFTIFSTLLLFSFSHASAESWWGGGSRKDDWVLERGGAMIFYQVKDESNNPEYSARLYLNNVLVETEKNARGVFDDAINNRYTVVILKGSQAVALTEVDVRPSENIRLTFDLDTNEVEKESQVLSVSKIRLNSDSSQYITPSDIEKLRDEEMVMLENDFQAIGYSIDQKFNEVHREGKITRLFFGSDEEKLAEIEVEIQKRAEKLEDLMDLEEGVTTEEKRSLIEGKLSPYAQELEINRKSLEEAKRNEGFWYRFATLL